MDGEKEKPGQRVKAVCPGRKIVPMSLPPWTEVTQDWKPPGTMGGETSQSNCTHTQIHT